MAPVSFDVLIAGLGPTGLTTALALVRSGLSVAVAGHPMAPERDTRAMALMGPSVTFLENIEAWPVCAPLAQPLTGIRIIDATGRLLRAPETTFKAEDIGRPSFGACITTADLLRALANLARSNDRIHLIETAGIQSIAFERAGVILTTAEGDKFDAPLLVGADGRNSPTRVAAGMTISEWSYPQTAVACTFRHGRAHDGVSIEFHRPPGPLTTVPLRDAPDGHASSLVWVETPTEAQHLMNLDDDAFARTLRERLWGTLGPIGHVSKRAAFPLSGLRAIPLARQRTALVGEAAHVMPPIGAQGLNLGLRDVAALSDTLGDALTRAGGGARSDLGSDAVLQAYDKARHSDVRSRLTAVDLLNRSLMSSQLPVQALRGFGLHMLSSMPVLRRSLIQQGLAASSTLPRSMQPRAAAQTAAG